MDILATATGLIILAVVLIVPGYFISLAFFPNRKDFDTIERAAFSVVFSITFLPLAVLVENMMFGIAITQVNAVFNLLAIIILSLVVYLVRTQKLIVPEVIYRVLPKVKKEEVAEIIPFFKKMRQIK